jgi:hypothetical protein
LEPINERKIAHDQYPIAIDGFKKSKLRNAGAKAYHSVNRSVLPVSSTASFEQTKLLKQKENALELIKKKAEIKQRLD